MEVGANPAPEREGLTDVDGLAGGVAEDVDARMVGKPFQLLLDAYRRGLSPHQDELARPRVLWSRLSTMWSEPASLRLGQARPGEAMFRGRLGPLPRE